MSGPGYVLDELRSVARIAKAASIGVTGNAPRIERAEAAIAAVSDLIAAATAVSDRDWTFLGDSERRDMYALRAALTRVGAAA